MRLIEKTIGAFRHLLNKYHPKGFLPVGFSIVFYDPKQKRWYYDMRNIIDAHQFNPHDQKMQERITLITEFLSEGVKRILEGQMDEFIEEAEDKGFQIPGMKGKA